MKNSILLRIMLGTLLPVIIVFIIIIGTINSIINVNNEKSIQDAAKSTASQLTSQITQKIYMLEVLQLNISNGLATIPFEQSHSRDDADSLLHTYLLSSSDIYSTWFSFDPNLFPDKQPYFKAEHLENSEEWKQKTRALAKRLMESQEEPEWYTKPFTTRETYINIFGRHRMAGDLEALPTLTMSSPIIKNDKAIGVVGVDLLYEDIVSFNDVKENEKVLLLSSDGIILYSQETSEIGKSLLSFEFDNKENIEAALQNNELWMNDIFSPFFNKETVAVLYPFNLQDRSETFFLYRGIPKSSAIGFFSLSMEIIYITSILGVILLAIFVFFTLRSVVSQIRRIGDSFQLVAKNSQDLDQVDKESLFTNTNIEELDVLQSSLKTMIVHLQEGQKLKLQGLAAELEKDKLIAAAEMKNNFFASMSHEIRTPMNAITGISELLLINDNLMPSQKKQVKDINIAASSLLEIINDIMDISKMENESMPLYPTHYMFPVLLDNIASMMGLIASKAGLEFSLKIESDVPNCLYGDDLRLRQLLLNLISNAIKYTPKGFVSVHVSKLDDELKFEISDSGIGMKSEDLKTIFEPFERVDTRRNRNTNGTGLGLTIVKNLTNIMRGKISVTSTYGEGSTFIVVLPYVIGDEDKVKHEKHVAKNIKYDESLSVLIVDDNEVNLKVAHGLFKALYGIECDTANSGLAAVAKARDMDYDIIFMDHMMPEMDGIDATHQIREMGQKYKQVPIVALTANASSDARELLLVQGLDDFLSKPIIKENLDEILERWVPHEKRIIEIDSEIDTVRETTYRPSVLNLPTSESSEMLIASDETLTALDEIDGLDLAIGLNNIALDKDMYIQSLRIMVQKIEPSTVALSKAIESKNMKDFHIIVHGLKGALANIGATNLAKKAGDFELAISHNEDLYCEKELPDFIDNLMDFSEKLTELLPSDIKISSNAIDFRSVNIFEQEILSLCVALDSYDYISITSALERIFALGGLIEEDEKILQEVKSLIESFDYYAARTLLENSYSF